MHNSWLTLLMVDRRGRLPPASYRLAANVATGASSRASSSSAISSSGSSNASNTASGGAATRVAAAADAAEGAAASTRGVFLLHVPATFQERSGTFSELSRCLFFLHVPRRANRPDVA